MTKKTARKWFSITAAAGGVGEISIFDFVDRFGASAKDFQRELKALGDVSHLNIHINSPGGDVFEGQAIYNLIRNHKAATKTVLIDGLAASIASVIAMAGDRIVMPANTMMMIHDPMLVAAGNSKEIRKSAEVLDKVKTTLVAAYQAKTGLETAEIEALMAEETWFTAAEAVDKGFADETSDAVEIAASFDLSKFQNVPPEISAALSGSGPEDDDAGDPNRKRRGSSTPHTKEAIMTDPEKLAAERKRVSAITTLAATLCLIALAPDKVFVDKLIDDGIPADEAETKLKAYKADKDAEAAKQPEVKAAVQTALAEERSRITEIRALGKQLKVDGVTEISAEIEKMITAGTSLNDARIKMIDLRAAHEEKSGPIISFSGNGQTFDNPTFRRDALATAFAHRSRPDLVKLTDQAKPYALHSLLEIAADCVRSRGVRVQIGDRDTLVIEAMHSTSDFPYILGNVANKILLPSYAAAASTYKMIAGQRDFNDFRAHSFTRLGDFPDLLKVDETGEVKAGTIGEGKETVYLYPYGRRLIVSRQMLINDDLSAFTNLAALAGVRVANFENAAVYTVLVSNSNLGPTMNDGLKLFHSTHTNYTSSGTAVNLPKELGLSRALLRKQTGIDGVKLNLQAKILLGGSDNETAMEQVTTQVTPAITSSVNKVGPSLTPVADANISGYGWYLLADPAVAPALIYGSLPGQTGPRVMTKEGWSVEGVEIKVMRDFGVGAIDFRPITFNAGTAPS